MLVRLQLVMPNKKGEHVDTINKQYSGTVVIEPGKRFDYCVTAVGNATFPDGTLFPDYAYYIDGHIEHKLRRWVREGMAEGEERGAYIGFSRGSDTLGYLHERERIQATPPRHVWDTTFPKRIYVKLRVDKISRRKSVQTARSASAELSRIIQEMGSITYEPLHIVDASAGSVTITDGTSS